jgi:hypothetical protein
LLSQIWIGSFEKKSDTLTGFWVLLYLITSSVNDPPCHRPCSHTPGNGRSNKCEDEAEVAERLARRQHTSTAGAQSATLARGYACGADLAAAAEAACSQYALLELLDEFDAHGAIR